MTVEKIERDGKVAVLVSPGFGAGWVTWLHQDEERAMFCPRLVLHVLGESDEPKSREEIANELFPDGYTGGVYKLKVQWVEKGRKFKYHEYDGSESLEFMDTEKWTEA